MNTENGRLMLAGLRIETVRKNIKNIHLGVYPPNGRVRVAAPFRITDEELKLLLVSKLPWIKRQQSKFSNQARETPREYVSGESHYLNGERYVLDLSHSGTQRKVEVRGNRTLVLTVPVNASIESREKTMDEFYRKELDRNLRETLPKCEKIVGVRAKEARIRKMRTKWGTCNPKAERIWINLELAKKSPKSLEYVVIHELVHILEKGHNERFKKIMDQVLPDWRLYRRNLNAAILSETKWPSVV